MSKLTVGSLFAGIGGFDLGLERAGFEIKWQVEIEPYAQRVLAKHWPRVTRYGDIRAIDWADVEATDVVCGGFPCQPHSLAGKRAGAADERDLWPEFVRCIRGTRPRWVVAENVPGLLSIDAGRFFGSVLRDLAESGYDAEWDCIPASAVGAPHQRDRLWLVAYPNGRRQQERAQFDGATLQDSANRNPRGRYVDGLRDEVADANRSRLERRDSEGVRERAGEWSIGPRGAYVFNADSERGFQSPESRCVQVAQRRTRDAGWWQSEPNVGRVAHGIPKRVDRLRGLGNAIVPQIAEWIGRRILEAEAGA